MCTKLEEAGLVQDQGEGPSAFGLWVQAIKAQFEADNLHLTMSPTAPGLSPLVAAVQNLGRSVGGMHAQLASMQREMAGMQRELTGFRQASSPQLRSPAPPRSRSGTPMRHMEELETETEAPAPAPPTPPPPMPTRGPLAGLGGLLPSSGQKPTQTLTDRKAHTFYGECMAEGGALPPLAPKQAKPKGELLLKWFSAMATQEEKAVLKPPPPAQPGQPAPKPPDEGQRRVICERLQARHAHHAHAPHACACPTRARALAPPLAHHALAYAHQGLLVARIQEAYVQAGISQGRDLQKADYKLPASGLASHDEKLRGAKVILDPSTFPAWRKEYETEDVFAEAGVTLQAASDTNPQPPPKKKPKK